MTVALGDNEAGAIRSYVTQWENIKAEIAETKEIRKAKIEVLNNEGYPAAGIRKILAQRKKDEDKMAEERQQIEEAAALLGETVYVGEVTPTDDWPDEKKERGQELIDELLEVEGELENLAESMKDLKKSIKGEGFAVSIIEQLVKYREDPNGWEENSLMFRAYKSAIGE